MSDSKLRGYRQRLEAQLQSRETVRQAEFERAKQQLEARIEDFRRRTTIAQDNYTTLNRLRLTADIQAILRMRHEMAFKDELSFPGLKFEREYACYETTRHYWEEFRHPDSERIVCLAAKNGSLADSVQPFLRVVSAKFSGYFYRRSGGLFDPDVWVLSNYSPGYGCQCHHPPTFNGKIPLSLPAVEIHLDKDAVVVISAYGGYAQCGHVKPKEHKYVAVTFHLLTDALFNPQTEADLRANAWLAELPVFSTRRFSEDEFVDLILRYNPKIRS